MTISEWVARFKPIINPEKLQSSGPLGYHNYLFSMGAGNLEKLEALDKKNEMYFWSLISDGKKKFIKSGCHHSNTDGYFITRKPPDKDYIINKI